MRAQAARVVVVVALLAAPSPVRAPAAEVAGSAARGRAIFTRGTGGAPVTALVGADGAEVPAAVMPCVSCHGPRGEGRPEGGVRPSDIRWAELTKPYGVAHESGRTHPPYDRRTLARAIVDGLDPAGQPLLLAMPRYRLAPADLEDLLVFLEGLGSYRDPGVTDDELRVGTLLPADAAAGDPFIEPLEAAFADVNARGGLFGRRIVLRAFPAAGSAAELASRLEREEVFALVGGVLPSDSALAESVLESEEIPLIGPWAQGTVATVASDGPVFHVLPGTREQALALVSFAARGSLPASRGALVAHPDTPTGRELGEAVAQRCRAAGFGHVERASFASGRAGELPMPSPPVSELLFLGNGADLAALLRASAAAPRPPRVLALGALAAQGAIAAPPLPGQQLYLAFPMAPGGTGPEPAADGARERPRRTGPVRASGDAAARVLLEGLRRAGRQLSREDLVQALEGLYRFETGVSAPVSFGPGRRVGASGAFIVRVDTTAGAFVPELEWVEADPG